MKFHDNRGMYDEIAKWLEENDVEVDWEAVMQCKWWVGPADWKPPSKWSIPAPFPERLTPQTATKLLFSQWWSRLSIYPELGDPLDDYVAPRMTSHQVQEQNQVMTCQLAEGGEGVDSEAAGGAATGPHAWKIFLKRLADIDHIEVIELKLITPEDRKALVRMAWIEEELRRREVEHNRERVNRQNRGEAKWYLSRKREGWLREKASHGNLEAIEEMERRGYGSMEEHKWWRELNRKLVENMRKVRGRRKPKQREQESGMGKKEEKKGEVKFEELEVVDTTEGKERGIEREVEVVRVGPNPRILTCRYKELAEERECRVRVKSVSHFVRGMKFRIREPEGEQEYNEPWEYEGKLPRAKGRW
jgi:hypothetical protein